MSYPQPVLHSDSDSIPETPALSHAPINDVTQTSPVSLSLWDTTQDIIMDICNLKTPLDHLTTTSSSAFFGIWSIFPNSAPCPLWPLFLPGRWKPRWLELGREFSALEGDSWLSPKRENIPFFFGSSFDSSFSPTSSKTSSSVGCGRSDWPEFRTADRGVRVIPESRLCLAHPSGPTGDLAEMSWKHSKLAINRD